MGNHGKLVIRQVNNPYNTEEALKNVLRYIVRQKEGREKEEVRYWRAFGASGKNIEKVIKQFIKIQKRAGKASRKRIRHFFISFPGYVDDVNVVKIIAEAVAAFVFEKYQVVYAVHEKKGNLHIHFAVNPVSYVDYYKWHMSSVEFREWKEKVTEIVKKCLAENGYRNIEL